MKIWTYISTLFAGIIAGLVIFLKLDKPETVINDNTRIGKMKQRGEGNEANVTIDSQPQPEPETRAEKREERKVGRIARRRKRKDKKETE